MGVSDSASMSVSAINATNIHPSKMSSTQHLLFALYLLILTICFVGHLVCIISIVRCKLYKHYRYQILVNLSISDMWFVLSTCPAFLCFEDDRYDMDSTAIRICAFAYSKAFLIGQMSLYSSVLLSIVLTMNQFLAVKYNIHYGRIVTQTKVTATLVLNWCTAFLLSIITHSVGPIKTKWRYISVRLVFYPVISTVLLLGVLIMSANLIYISKVSSEHFKSLSIIEKQSPYWIGRLRKNREVTILTLVKIVTLIPSGVDLIKATFYPVDEGDKLIIINRGLLMLHCTLNPFLYMSTWRELKEFTVSKYCKFNVVRPRQIEVTTE